MTEQAVATRYRMRWVAGLALSMVVAVGCTPRPPGLDASEQPLALVPAKVLEAPANPTRLMSDTASAEVQWLAARVAATQDHGGRGFVIVDKKNARAHVFDARARPHTSTPVLIGAAVGDHTVPGIGIRPMHLVLPEERTTPAGRFVGEPGRNTSGEDIVWVDYDAAVSMHRVRATRADEQRLQRLASPTVDDNRISYGCINVPAAFYDAHIKGLFAKGKAMVYVLPDTRSQQQVFGALLGTQHAVTQLRN
jgi:hypothetical protein